MLSLLRKLLGHEDKFHDLLEASAEEALASTQLLAQYLRRSEAYTSTNDLDEFIHSRRKDKKITRQISEELAKTFVTPIEREDIEALSVALYRVPKTVEKLVERLSIYPGNLPREGFERQTQLMTQAAEIGVKMVKELRGGTHMEKIATSQDRLQWTERARPTKSCSDSSSSFTTATAQRRSSSSSRSSTSWPKRSLIAVATPATSWSRSC